jgi:superfamily II DNA/RNA helicase
VAIPLIVQKNEEGGYDDLIAQSKNGSGKTGAFVIGSLIRVDPAIKKPQVIVFGHTRELVNQIAAVYAKAVAHAPDYKVTNLVGEGAKDPKAQIIVTTLGKLKSSLQGKFKIDLSGLRCVVIDEADFFFEDQKNHTELMAIHKTFQD